MGLTERNRKELRKETPDGVAARGSISRNAIRSGDRSCRKKAKKAGTGEPLQNRDLSCRKKTQELTKKVTHSQHAATCRSISLACAFRLRAQSISLERVFFFRVLVFFAATPIPPLGLPLFAFFSLFSATPWACPSVWRGSPFLRVLGFLAATQSGVSFCRFFRVFSAFPVWLPGSICSLVRQRTPCHSALV